MTKHFTPGRCLQLALAFLLLFLGLPDQSMGQLRFVRYDSIEVRAGSDILANPWAGGMNSPQFSEIDLNGDGLKDLFTFERNWYGMVKTYINGGSPGQIDYHHEPRYAHAFPFMHNWTLLADYNCDGKEDIFTSVPAGVAVYRNDSDSSGLKFTKVSALLQSETPDGLSSIYVSPPDIPALTDVDGDGDMDVLSFDVLGKTISYHKNLSLERYGNCDHLEFEQASSCWGYFSESEQDNSISLFDSCSSTPSKDQEGERHAGSAILALDLKGNTLKDLLLGDISYNNLVMLTNDGSNYEASMIDVDTAFPSYDIAVDLKVFPAPFLLDVNNDLKKDLIVSPNNPNTADNFNNIWYYKNTGTETNPVFEFQSRHFLQNQMIDVGEGARPQFFDADADGLLDIVIGNYGYASEGGDFDSKLALLRNTGTPTSPSFELQDRDYAGLSVLQLKGAYPAFGDMDSDGDSDMLVGDEEGNLHLFTNTADPGTSAQFSLSIPVFMGIDIGETAMPQIVDVNRDNLPDLLVGERSGTINYFQNTGTAEEAFFSTLPTNDFFGEVDVMIPCCSGYSVPFLTQDSIDKHLLYVSSESGYLYQFNEIEGNLNGSFKLVDSLFLGGLNATVSGADLNNDGDIELIYGAYAGGLAILKTGTPEWIGWPEKKYGQLGVSLFPNPAHAEVNIQLAGHPRGEVYIQIINHLNLVMKSGSFLSSDGGFQIDVGNLTPGLYVVNIQTSGTNSKKKLIIY